MTILTSIKHKLRLSLVAIIFIIAAGSIYSFYLLQRSKDYLNFKEQVISILLDLKETQEQTAGLLQTSQIQTDKLRAQEEEMRQHLEEMAATQDDFSRREKELKEIIENLKIENLELKHSLNGQTISD